MTTAVENIKAAKETGLVDEHGGCVSLELLPPLSPEEIETLQKRVGLTLPEELREVLAYCSGIEEGLVPGIDFTGESMAYEQAEMFPNGLPIAADGAGNFWVLDLTPQTAKVAPVFFACHDAPVILFQSADLASFLLGVFRMNEAQGRSAAMEIAEDWLFDVWRKNPGVVDQPAALSSSDPVIRAFAGTLSQNFQIVDLRNAPVGMGFSWGRYGPRTEVRRHGYERIFAYAKPERSGLLGKLFGR